MSNTKHTPGPWFFVNGEIHDREPKFDESGARVGDTLNSIAEVHLVPTGCKYANGDLMAAAPDLLAALEEIAYIFCNSDTTNKYAEEMADIAAKAIAKAEGK
jgi:hypothetical protein